MPSLIVLRPNGLYARFSTIVDDFTCMNATEQEIVDVIRQEWVERSEIEARRAIESAKSWTGKFDDCVFTVSEIHGADVAEERRKLASTDNSDAPDSEKGPKGAN